MSDPLLPQTEQMLQALLRDFHERVAHQDTNRDGHIDRRDGEEVNAQWFDLDTQDAVARYSQSVDAVVRLFDGNGNGTLDAEEAAYFEEIRPELENMIPSLGTMTSDVFRGHVGMGGDAPPITSETIGREFEAIMGDLRAAMIDQGIVEAPAAEPSALSASVNDANRGHSR